MTVKQAYIAARACLAAASVDDPGFDTACILEKHTGVKRYEIPLKGDGQITHEREFWADIARREAHEPLQYIVGMWPFYGLDFFVGDGVLIPRQDTEILCATAIESLKGSSGAHVLELCAGSGCVTAGILKNTDKSSAVCVEISDKAMLYLKKNLSYNGLDDRTEIVKADILNSQSAAEISGEFDIIVCNPPYIRSGDIAGLEPEVAQYEPKIALDGGDDGLKFYRAAVVYFPLLKNGAHVFFEVGAGQAHDVEKILSQAGLSDIVVKKDYSGIERVVGGRRMD